MSEDLTEAAAMYATRQGALQPFMTAGVSRRNMSPALDMFARRVYEVRQDARVVPMRPPTAVYMHIHV